MSKMGQKSEKPGVLHSTTEQLLKWFCETSMSSLRTKVVKT